MLFATVALTVPGWGWGHHAVWPWGGLMMIGWWLLIGVAVVLVFRALSRPARDAGHQAEDVLAGRYARGEIDEQEFRSRLAVLKERR